MSEQVTWGSDGYAGFWRRAGGYLIDAIIFYALSFAVGLVFGVAFGVGGATDDAFGGLTAGLQLVFLTLWFLYDTIMTSKFGWTVGKRAVNVEVRTADGHLPSYGLAIGRFFARILSAIPLLLGYFWAGWDAKKQTWHDKICSTYVIKRENIGVGRELAATSGWGTQPGWGAAEQQGQQGWGAPAQQGWGSPVQSGGWGSPSGQQPPAQPQGQAAGRDEASQGSALGAAAGGAISGETMESATWSTARSSDEPRGAEGTDAPGWETAASVPGSPEETQPPREPDQRQASESEPAAAQLPGTEQSGWEAPPGEPAPTQDPNLVAIDRSGVGGDSAAWVRQVAEQVDARLERVAPGWRSSAQADAARACAFGLLVGHLGRTYPHMEPDLGRVAESHPSFSTLLEGSRLSTLEQIAGDPGRATAWLGPLVDVSDPSQIRHLFD